MKTKKELYDDFVDFHTKYPDIWKEFEVIALKATDIYDSFGSRAVLEIVRWDSAVKGGKPFKIINAAAPYYARLFMQKYPEHKGFFKTKEGLYWEDL